MTRQCKSCRFSLELVGARGFEPASAKASARRPPTPRSRTEERSAYFLSKNPVTIGSMPSACLFPLTETNVRPFRSLTLPYRARVVAISQIAGTGPIPSGWRPSPDCRQNLSDPGDVLFWIGDFRVELSPLQSTRALRLHRPLRGRHAVHRLCAKPACARTGAQQRPWREVHRGPASGAARVSGSVPVCREGAGTRVRGQATYSRAEGRVGRQRETAPPLNQYFQKRL